MMSSSGEFHPGTWKSFFFQILAITLIDLFQAHFDPRILPYVAQWHRAGLAFGPVVFVVPLVVAISFAVWILFRTRALWRHVAGQGYGTEAGLTLFFIGLFPFTWAKQPELPLLATITGIGRHLCGLQALYFLWSVSCPVLEHWGSRLLSGLETLSGGKFFLILALVFLVPLFALFQGVLGGVPHIQDDIVYDWQARLLAIHKVACDFLPVPEFLKLPFTAVIDGKVVGQYPPGWPIILALGYACGAAWLIPPLLALIFVILFGLLLFWCVGEKSARWALVMAGLCPFVLLQGSSYMSHIPGMICFFTMLLGLVLALRHEFCGAPLSTGQPCQTAIDAVKRHTDAAAGRIRTIRKSDNSAEWPVGMSPCLV